MAGKAVLHLLSEHGWVYNRAGTSHQGCSNYRVPDTRWGRLRHLTLKSSIATHLTRSYWQDPELYTRILSEIDSSGQFSTRLVGGLSDWDLKQQPSKKKKKRSVCMCACVWGGVSIHVFILFFLSNLKYSTLTCNTVFCWSNGWD